MYIIVPGAQVAGKLAVALVDTARVFEMFVAVILIGKHLPASLTLIPGAACQTHTPRQHDVH